MIRISIDGAAGLVTHMGSGAVSIGEIEAAFEARLENPDFRPGMKVLWDCREASISTLSADGIHRLIGFNDRYKDARGDGMSAIVVSGDLDYGIGRMFQAYAHDLPWETMVFRDFNSAIQWLSDPDSGRITEPA